MTTVAEHHLTAGDLDIAISDFGDVTCVAAGGIQVSQYHPSAHDAGVSGLWLRRHRNSEVRSVPLTGVRSTSTWRQTGSGVLWQGIGLGVAWNVTLRAASQGSAWTWTVSITPDATLDGSDDQAAEGDLWDVAFAQDVSLAPAVVAQSSEPYISQYVAYHSELTQSMGHVLAARQTMACAPQLPLLVCAINEGSVAYLTDGFDFYGRTARMGDAPVALDDARIENAWDGGHINQYEFGMVCLLSSARPLGQSVSWTEICYCDADYRGEMGDACLHMADEIVPSVMKETAESAAAVGDDIVAADAEEESPAPSLLATSAVLNGDELDDAAFKALANGSVIDPEYDARGRLLSYFTDNAAHVVSRAKELMVDRSHGQILLAGGSTDPDIPAFAVTTYVPGVFASHIVLGNTNMNRLVSVQRNALNLLRSQGVRLMVRPAGSGEWRVLGVPSAYVMNLGGSRWVYRHAGETLTVETVASAERNIMEIRMDSSVPLDAMMSIDVEYAENWQPDRESSYPESVSGVVLVPAEGSAVASHCPKWAYAFASDGAMIGSDAPLFDGRPRNTSVMTFAQDDVRGLRVVIAASSEGANHARSLAVGAVNRPMDVESTYARHYDIINGFADHLTVHGQGRLAEFNLSAPWFVQNALVHFLSPHGLEQYSGAAWGTRDVCQGPFEMALAFGHFDTARKVILKVLAHQNGDGSLPQWFMFDEYAEMYQHDSHGDIPVWPLMAVGEYLEASGDATILDETVPFWDPEHDRPLSTDRITDETTGISDPTVADHLKRTLDYIRGHRVPGTELFCYGEGDWDDTLQPAQESLKKEMASTWTIALLYQAAGVLERLLAETRPDLAEEFGKEADTIRSVFDKDFVFDDVLSGYVRFDNGKPTPVIHPTDKRTGMDYRLIPMTRSIIAGLLSDDGVLRHERIINEHLHYPDGVRLMNRPAPYHDGITTVFRRGEQSANVGREIGLMYTHAHIRYTEALGILGRESLAEELLRINPVGQCHRLPTSEPRQRNCYFASSDADFPDRYTAASQWDRLREGAADPVGVRGGWRVYSSGPGIYLRQMMQHVFGLELHAGYVVFDPVLAPEDDGLEISVELFGIPRTIRYHVVPGNTPVTVTADGAPLRGERRKLRYREGGLNVSAESLGRSACIDVTVGADRTDIGR